MREPLISSPAVEIGEPISARFPQIEGHCYLTGRDALLRFFQVMGYEVGRQIQISVNQTIYYQGFVTTNGLSLREYLCTGKDTDGDKVWEPIGTSYQDGFAYLLSRAKNGDEIFYKANYLVGGINNKAFVNSTDVFAEDDGRTEVEQWENVDRFVRYSKIQPTAIVHSGNKSLHLHNRLEKPVDAATWENLSKHYCAQLGSDPAVTTLHRQLRLPGFPRRRKDGTWGEVALLVANDTGSTPEAFKQALEETWTYAQPFTMARWKKYTSAVAQSRTQMSIASLSVPSDAFQLPDSVLFPSATTTTYMEQRSTDSEGLQKDSENPWEVFLNDELMPALEQMTVEEIFNEYPHDFTLVGSELVGKSPWSLHNSSGTSFQVNTKGYWYCWASEQSSQSPLQYLQLVWFGRVGRELRGRDFILFCKKLAAKVGISIPETLENSRYEQNGAASAGERQITRQEWEQKQELEREMNEVSTVSPDRLGEVLKLFGPDSPVLSQEYETAIGYIRQDPDFQKARQILGLDVSEYQIWRALCYHYRWCAPLDVIAANLQAKKSDFKKAIEASKKLIDPAKVLTAIEDLTDTASDEKLVEVGVEVGLSKHQVERLIKLKGYDGFEIERAIKIASLKREDYRRIAGRHDSDPFGEQTVLSSSEGSDRGQILPQWEAPFSSNGHLLRREMHGRGKNAYEVIVPVANFDFTIERILQSDAGGGLVLAVSRLVAGEMRVSRVILDSQKDCGKPLDFANGIKRGLGTNISCTLRPDELQALLAIKTESYYRNGGRDYRLIDRVGQQEDGTWVFENIQFTSSGQITTEGESGWVWNPTLGEVEKIPSPKIGIQDSEALNRLGAACKNCFHPDTLPLVLFNCGFATATLHRQQIYKEERFFPQMANFGDRGGGKTTGALVASSLVGMDKTISKFSESLAFELVKCLSGIVVVFDDPITKGMKREERDKVDDFVWKLFNGAARKVRGNEQEPHTAVILTTNVAIGEDNSATESRLVKPYFPVRKFRKDGFSALKRAMKTASGGISQLIALGYNAAAVSALSEQIAERLHTPHDRVSHNLAIVTHYTQRFCDLAGIEFDALQYCLDYFCPAADETGSDVDSLTDFLEKLQILKSQTLIGDWNTAIVDTKEGKHLAVWLADVWEIFNQKFPSVNYSKQSLTGLAKERNGESNKPAKFVESKLVWEGYLKAAAAHQRGEVNLAPANPPERKSVMPC